MRALLRLSLLFSSASLISACLFPGFDDLVCESDCGGSTATATPTGAGSQGGAGAGSTGGVDPGGAGPGGGGGGGTPDPPCAPPNGSGPVGVEINPPGDGFSNYCIDRFEVTWGEYKPFVETFIAFANPDEFDDWAGPDCGFQGQSESAFKDNGGFWSYLWSNQPEEDMPKPAVGMNWCEARIYCESQGKHLCGGVDGGPDDGEDNLSQWSAACSGFSVHHYTYAGLYDETKCFTGECIDQGRGNPFEHHALWGTDQLTCESAAHPGLFNMTGNADELVDNCVNEPKDLNPANDVCRALGGSCNIGMSSRCSFKGNSAFARDARANYRTFRCCWPPQL